jgi:hypothetical protein
MALGWLQGAGAYQNLKRQSPSWQQAQGRGDRAGSFERKLNLEACAMRAIYKICDAAEWAEVHRPTESYQKEFFESGGDLGDAPDLVP